MSVLTEDEGWRRARKAAIAAPSADIIDALCDYAETYAAPAPDPAGDTDWWNDTGAAVERVRALIEYHEANMNDYGLSHVVHTDELRAALDGTEETP